MKLHLCDRDSLADVVRGYTVDSARTIAVTSASYRKTKHCMRELSHGDGVESASCAVDRFICRYQGGTQVIGLPVGDGSRFRGLRPYVLIVVDPDEVPREVHDRLCEAVTATVAIDLPVNESEDFAIGQVLDGRDDVKMTVLGALRGDVYAGMCPDREHVGWDRDFPGWRDGAVVAIAYDPPQKPYTFEEYRSFDPDMPEQVATWLYDRVPPAARMWVPAMALRGTRRF